MKLRRVYPLIIGLVVVPAAMMLTVGILILVFGRQKQDYVFGTLILALVATTIIGTRRHAGRALPGGLRLAGCRPTS